MKYPRQSLSQSILLRCFRFLSALESELPTQRQYISIKIRINQIMPLYNNMNILENGGRSSGMNVAQIQKSIVNLLSKTYVATTTQKINASHQSLDQLSGNPQFLSSCLEILKNSTHTHQLHTALTNYMYILSQHYIEKGCQVERQLCIRLENCLGKAVESKEIRLAFKPKLIETFVELYLENNKSRNNAVNKICSTILYYVHVKRILVAVYYYHSLMGKANISLAAKAEINLKILKEIIPFLSTAHASQDDSFFTSAQTISTLVQSFPIICEIICQLDLLAFSEILGFLSGSRQFLGICEFVLGCGSMEEEWERCRQGSLKALTHVLGSNRKLARESADIIDFSVHKIFPAYWGRNIANTMFLKQFQFMVEILALRRELPIRMYSPGDYTQTIECIRGAFFIPMQSSFLTCQSDSLIDLIYQSHSLTERSPEELDLLEEIHILHAFPKIVLSYIDHVNLDQLPIMLLDFVISRLKNKEQHEELGLLLSILLQPLFLSRLSYLSRIQNFLHNCSLIQNQRQLLLLLLYRAYLPHINPPRCLLSELIVLSQEQAHPYPKIVVEVMREFIQCAHQFSFYSNSILQLLQQSRLQGNWRLYLTILKTYLHDFKTPQIMESISLLPASFEFLSQECIQNYIQIFEIIFTETEIEQCDYYCGLMAYFCSEVIPKLRDKLHAHVVQVSLTIRKGFQCIGSRKGECTQENFSQALQALSGISISLCELICDESYKFPLRHEEDAVQPIYSLYWLLPKQEGGPAETLLHKIFCYLGIDPFGQVLHKTFDSSIKMLIMLHYLVIQHPSIFTVRDISYMCTFIAESFQKYEQVDQFTTDKFFILSKLATLFVLLIVHHPTALQEVYLLTPDKMERQLFMPIFNSSRIFHTFYDLPLVIESLVTVLGPIIHGRLHQFHMKFAHLLLALLLQSSEKLYLQINKNLSFESQIFQPLNHSQQFLSLYHRVLQIYKEILVRPTHQTGNKFLFRHMRGVCKDERGESKHVLGEFCSLMGGILGCRREWAMRVMDRLVDKKTLERVSEMMETRFDHKLSRPRRMARVRKQV